MGWLSAARSAHEFRDRFDEEASSLRPFPPEEERETVPRVRVSVEQRGVNSEQFVLDNVISLGTQLAHAVPPRIPAGRSRRSVISV